MSNNNPQENSKAFEQAVDLLANILVDIIDSKKTEETARISDRRKLEFNQIKKHGKTTNKKRRG